MSKADLRLDFVDHKAAKYAVEHWHYSKRMPQGRLVKVGAWEKGAYIGVVLFGHGGSSHLGSIIGLKTFEVCELVRVALREHLAPVSRIVAIALKMLQRSSPGVRAVVSFADPSEGHHGGIYQAMGWTYTGNSAADRLYYFGGRWCHSRSFRAAFGDANESKGARLYQAGKLPMRLSSPKLRYIIALDPARRDRVKALAKPYPKRHDNQASESSSCQVPPDGGRGSTDPDAPSCQPSAGARPASMPLETVIAAVRGALTDELRRPKYRGNRNPMAGHCYVASEALYHLLGGKGGDWRSVRLRHEDDSHWFLRRPSDGAVLDITASQFKTPVPAEKAKGAGFLTREPSKRAQVVIKRAQAALTRTAYNQQDERRAKKQARNAVRSALRNGTMKRQPCKHAGPDCRGKVASHHTHGYDRAHWLDVEWLCRFHHEAEHAEKAVSS
jgi:hypothetical protein